jgi:hypothetical protein
LRQQKNLRIGFIYNNPWQRALYEKFINESNRKAKIYPIEIFGFYSKDYKATNHALYSIVRSNSRFKQFSILDGIFNYVAIRKQIRSKIIPLNLDILILDNVDRYIERICLKFISGKTTIIFMQHGFDPMERIFRSKKSFFSCLNIFLRNLIFTKVLSFNPFHAPTLFDKSVFIVYSEYVKEKMKIYVPNGKVYISKNPSLSVDNSKIKFGSIKSTKAKNLLVFTGVFRYERFDKFLVHFFSNLEKLPFDNIILKPKIGEAKKLNFFLSNHDLTKNYTILNFESNMKEILEQYSNIMCSIESTVCLELIVRGYKSFYVYDYEFYRHSIIKSSIKIFCHNLNDRIYKFNFSSDQAECKSLNYFLGMNLNSINLNDVDV